MFAQILKLISDGKTDDVDDYGDVDIVNTNGIVHPVYYCVCRL
jgi:hypothetical protein